MENLTVSLPNSHANAVVSPGRSRVEYEPALQDSEREAVADLLQYLENVRPLKMSQTMEQTN